MFHSNNHDSTKFQLNCLSKTNLKLYLYKRKYVTGNETKF